MTQVLDMPAVVAELQARSLGSDDDREAWLAARTQCITATEAKLLVQAGTATARTRVVEDLIDEKLNGSKFHGNHFTEWGKLREPFILAELEWRYGITGCGLLVHAEGNTAHAATPDGAGVDFDGRLVLAEIKTSKNDVSLGSPKFDQAGYFFQMQWQMYCTGADRVLYVIEQHNDDWSGWDLNDRSTWRVESGPTALPLVVAWVERDQKVIDRMVALADEALAALDYAREHSGAAEAAEVVVFERAAEVARLSDEVVAGRKAEAAGKSAKEAAWKQLLAIGAESGSFSEAGELGTVRYVAAVSEVVEVPDVDAAVAAHPKEWAQLERARKRLASLEEAWAVLQAVHVVEETRAGKPSLTVTAARAKKEKK